MCILLSAHLSGLLSGVAEVSAQVGGGVVGDDSGLIFFWGGFGFCTRGKGGILLLYSFACLLVLFLTWFCIPCRNGCYLLLKECGSDTSLCLGTSLLMLMLMPINAWISNHDLPL